MSHLVAQLLTYKNEDYGTSALIIFILLKTVNILHLPSHLISKQLSLETQIWRYTLHLLNSQEIYSPLHTCSFGVNPLKPHLLGKNPENIHVGIIQGFRLYTLQTAAWNAWAPVLYLRLLHLNCLAQNRIQF